MKVLERKLYEQPKVEEDREVILLVSDNTERRFNIAIIKAKPIIDLTNAVYLFPYMVSEKMARESYEKIYNGLKN